MKFSLSTILLAIVALALGAFIYFYDVRGSQEREAAKATAEQIFDFEKDSVAAIAITKPEQTFKFERVKGEDDSSKWQMKSPEDAPASDPAISFLLDTLVDGKKQKTLSIAASELGDYGLDKPQATIEVKLEGGKTHQVVLGKSDFQRSSLYARIDPPAKDGDGEVEVLLVPFDFEYGIDRPVAEWKEAKPEKAEGEEVEKGEDEIEPKLDSQSDKETETTQEAEEEKSPAED